MTRLENPRADVTTGGYARPDALVTTARLADHLDDPTLESADAFRTICIAAGEP